MRRPLLLVVLLPMLALALPAIAEKLELENGDKIDVTIIEETEEGFVVEHPQLGTFTVPHSAIKPPPPPKPGLFGTSFMEGWKRNLGFGFSGSSGNSQDASVNASIGFSRKAETFRGAFDSAYFYSSQASVKNSNEFFAGYQHDFLFKESRFFIFGRGRYQFDQFQSWRHRISGSGGVGYDIFRKDKLDLSLRLGAGVARTEGTEKQWKPEGVAGLKGSWRPFEGHEFAADATYFPNFNNLPEFRVLINASYEVAITPIGGLSLRVGLKEEYDAAVETKTPVNGVFLKKNNLKYFGRLMYEF